MGLQGSRRTLGLFFCVYDHFPFLLFCIYHRRVLLLFPRLFACCVAVCAKSETRPLSKMALRAMISVLLLLLVHTSHGHFTINYPTPLGSDSNNEGIGPCGGFKFSDAPSVSEFHVGGDAIALVTTHPQANILFRATLDTTASENWSQLWPIVGQYGLGAYCQASVTVPAGWAGSNGIIQVIEDAVDGTLYQVGCRSSTFLPVQPADELMESAPV